MDQLTQSKLSDMVSHTQTLSTVAYEYDKELVMTKVAQAEEIMLDFEEMQERLKELEDENKGLRQTMLEMREDQKQIRLLHAMDVPELSNGSMLPVGSNAAVPLEAEAQSELSERPQGTLYTEEMTPVKLNTSLNIDDMATYTPASVQKDDPLAVADALASIAGKSQAGIAASASKMLREYDMVKSDLEMERARNEALVKELDELNMTMTSKTFKAPSAWAEREVKYKQEKLAWEERFLEMEDKIQTLDHENRKLKSAKGTMDLTKKIIDLEAQLVDVQRDKNKLEASLHDMKVKSLANSGEFSSCGVRPADIDENVKSVVTKFESASESVDVSSSSNNYADTAENSARFMSTMSTIPDQLNQLEKAKGELEKVQCERKELDAQLAGLIVSHEGHAIDNDDLNPIDSVQDETELALLESGVPMETATKLARLEGRLLAIQAESKDDFKTPEENENEEEQDKSSSHGSDTNSCVNALSAGNSGDAKEEEETLRDELENIVATVPGDVRKMLAVQLKYEDKVSKISKNISEALLRLSAQGGSSLPEAESGSIDDDDDGMKINPDESVEVAKRIEVLKENIQNKKQNYTAEGGTEQMNTVLDAVLDTNLPVEKSNLSDNSRKTDASVEVC